MINKQMYLTLGFLFGIISIAFSQEVVIRQSKADGIYKDGEKIRFVVVPGKGAGDTLTIRIRKEHTSNPLIKKVLSKGDSIEVFNERMKGPTTVMVEVTSKTETAFLGAIVSPEKYKPGYKEPADFKSYWKEQKRQLRALPMEVERKKLTTKDSGYSCEEIAINTTGEKKARGYFAKPTGAAPKSLPIVLLVHAAGVNGSWCKSQPENPLRYAKMGKGVLAFDLNAHGMLVGQDDKYYDDLNVGELKDYPNKGMENRESVYFKQMYLRLIRTLDFLTSQPEWDGKHVLVYGESQGGGQSLAAAGLDPRVSAVVAIVPAMCDWGGTLVGRRGGWPQPLENAGDKKEQVAKANPYFDAALLLKYSKATIYTEIGLVDMTCPCTSVYAAINQAKGTKIIKVVPYRQHHAPSNYLKEVWNKNFNQPKEEAIKRFVETGKL